MSIKIRLGVIIVTYNRIALLKEAVDACLNQTVMFDNIVIVNNASNDGTKEYLDTLNVEHLKIINLEKNIGGAGGFYEGVKYLFDKKLDYVLFIDDDAILDKKYNEIIVNHIIKNNIKNIIGFSGTVYTDNKIIYTHRRFLKKNFIQYNSSKEYYDKEFFDYDLSTFCGLYLNHNIIKKIGLPNEKFFIWYDDTEYCLRAIKYGKIRNINMAFLNHKTKIESEKGYNWKSYYGIRNKYIIISKYYSKTVLLKYTIDIRLHIIYSKIISIFLKNDYYKKVAKMYEDALFNAKNNQLGINEKYTYKFKMER